MSTTDIPAAGWYCENRTGNHHKFYAVIVAEDGTCALSWGRIGTSGQGKVQKFASLGDAEALGKKQVYSKLSGGYTLWTDELKFTLTDAQLQGAVRTGDASHLMRTFHAARLEPQYQGEKKVVVKHYDDFVEKAQRLMTEAGSRPFDEVYAEFEELETAWTAISDKHAEAEVTISLTKQMLSQRLMSGAL